MRLTAQEREMLDGKYGEAVRLGLELQLQVGEFFGAESFVPVTSVHLMAEIESMGEAGLQWVEQLADCGQQVCVPTTCNPRSVDFELWARVGQDRAQVELEVRLSWALRRLGVLTVNTCIPYQVFGGPCFGEHIAWGDTGAVIFANSVMGARTNYEGGPAALAAALTGRTPCYGYHLPEHRVGTVLVEVEEQPANQSDWDALGCYVGRLVNNYWEVPVFAGLQVRPIIDQLKRLGACLASFGSLAMFHIVGVTPEAATLDQAFAGRPPRRRLTVSAGALRRTYESFVSEKTEADLVVFSAPQLSVMELRDLAARLDGKKVHPNTRLIVTTSDAYCSIGQ